jgi:hypothetical protein
MDRIPGWLKVLLVGLAIWFVYKAPQAAASATKDAGGFLGKFADSATTFLTALL